AFRGVLRHNTKGGFFFVPGIMVVAAQVFFCKFDCQAYGRIFWTLPGWNQAGIDPRRRKSCHRPMLKRVLKFLYGIALAILIAGAIFLTNLIWFRPWNLNLFYEKIFAEAIFKEPELLSSLGLVEQFGITSHNGKLNDVSPAHQEEVVASFKKDLAQLHHYPLERQAPSPRLS